MIYEAGSKCKQAGHLASRQRLAAPALGTPRPHSSAGTWLSEAIGTERRPPAHLPSSAEKKAPWPMTTILNLSRHTHRLQRYGRNALLPAPFALT